MSGSVGDDEPKHTPILKLIDSSLRLSVVPLSVATIWLTVTNQEDNTTFGKLDFSSLMGLRYMICVSAICAGYALVAAISSWLKCLATKAWLFFVSDQVVAYLMVTSVAAAIERVHLVYNGDKEVSWSEACSTYGRFCSRMKLGLIVHSFVLCCFLVLAVISAYRTFSVFEPPATVSSKDVDEERTS